ncbi:MAG: hypothetical protein LLG00_00235 [Planctomycetaceae bacterium]|nr:hypothetical protein [Planctomycetaceae bacterium]
MTALDQALIRAFQQQSASPVTLPPQPAPKAPPRRAAARPAAPSTAKSPTAATSIPQAEPEASAALSLSDVFSGVLAALEKTPQQPAPAENPEVGPNRGTVTAADIPEKTTSRRRTVRTTTPVQTGGRANSSAQTVANSPSIEIGGPWMLGNEQWIVGSGQWATVGGQGGQEIANTTPAAPRIKAKGIDLSAGPIPTADQWPSAATYSYEPTPTNAWPTAEPPAREVAGEPQEPVFDERVTNAGPSPSRARSVAAMKPAWQVDRLTWPRVCRRLMAEAVDEWDRLCDAIVDAGEKGQKVLAIAGCRRGEGATTLLLCAASRLSERGIKTILVDADAQRPRIAKRLGIQPQDGWDDVTAEDGSGLEQALVESTSGGIAVLPLRDSQNTQKTLNWPRLSGCLERLRDHYELVLVDLGPLEDADWAAGAPNWATPGGIDAVLLACDRRLTDENQLSEAARKLTAAGVPVAGTIENFSRTDEPCTSPTGD